MGIARWLQIEALRALNEHLRSRLRTWDIKRRPVQLRARWGGAGWEAGKVGDSSGSGPWVTNWALGPSWVR